MSNIPKTVKNREKLSIDVKQEVIYELSNIEKKFDLRWPLKVKESRSNPKNFDVEYLD